MEGRKNISDRIIDYIPQGKELDVALACYNLQFPLMLRGPTGTGKTTFVYLLSRILEKPLIRQLCTEDVIAADIIGRNLQTGWMDGSVTESLRYTGGALYYMDELDDARSDVMTVVHSLSDDLREIKVTGHADAVRGHTETLKAPLEWMLIASYNPGYKLRSNIRPSMAQRFITIDIPFPKESLEIKIIQSYLEGRKIGEKGEIFSQTYSSKKNEVPIKELARLGNDYRRIAESSDISGLREGPGSRLIARTAKLIEYGLPLMLAIEVGIINPLTYKKDIKEGMIDIAHKLFR